MRQFFFLIIVTFMVSFAFNSCTHSDCQNKYHKAHKVEMELLYNYDSCHDESFNDGLLEIIKEARIFQDSTSDYFLRFEFIKDHIRNDVTAQYRELKLNEEELKRLVVFLDSCTSVSLTSEYDAWEIKVRNDTTISYFSKEKRLSLKFNMNDTYDFYMSPKELKEIIKKSQK